MERKIVANTMSYSQSWFACNADLQVIPLQQLQKYRNLFR